MHAFAVERRQLLGTKSRAMLTISRGKERLNTNNDNSSGINDDTKLRLTNGGCPVAVAVLVFVVAACPVCRLCLNWELSWRLRLPSVTAYIPQPQTRNPKQENLMTQNTNPKLNSLNRNPYITRGKPA